MKYKNVPELLEFTHNDLISIANTEFDLGVNKKFTKKEIAAMIMAAQKSGVRSDVEVLRGEAREKASETDLPEGYCVLKVSRSPNNPKGRPIPVGMNGKISVIPTGIPIKAPEWLLEILHNAVTETIVKDDELDEEKVVKSPSYPFTVLKHNPSPKWKEIESRMEIAGEQDDFVVG